MPNRGIGKKFGCTGTALSRDWVVCEKDVKMTSWWESASIVWSDAEKFFPTRVRITITQVAAGSLYSGSN